MPLIVTASLGTRLGVDLEWQELARWCREIGLRIVERWPLALRYLSPAFETNARRAGGVPECPINWRRGDLVLLECDGSRPNASLAPVCKLVRPWNDLSIGRILVKSRCDQARYDGSPILYDMVPNEVLPSVSRRDQRLHEVALWTSGNRIFGSQNVPVLRAIIKAMTFGGSAITELMNRLGLVQGDAQMREAEMAAARLREAFEAEELELEEWNRRLNANVVQLAS